MNSSTGINTQALDRKKQWEFTPGSFKVGDKVTGGDIIGSTVENTLIIHRVMVPPASMVQVHF